MRPRLRSRWILAAVLAAGTAACALLILAHYLVVAGLVHRAPPGDVVPVLPWVALAAVLVVGMVAVVLAVRRRGRERERALHSLAVRLAKQPASQVPEGSDGVEASLYALAERLAAAQSSRDDARLLGQLLLQTGTEYTLICTPEGRIVDANAALLARVGLSAGQLRSGPTYLREDILNLGPLLSLAVRSQEEDTMVTGIPHNLVVDGEVRPVEASVRMVPLTSGAVVVISMNDRSQEMQLERQIDQYSDAIELMVDQRVARIAAARESIEEIFSRAGAALFMFDRSGNTEKMNGAAEALTGRTQFTLRRFSDVASVLLPGEAESRRVANWFFTGQGNTRAEVVVTPSGSHEMLLLSGVELHGSAISRRLLAVVPLPRETGSGEQLPSRNPLGRLEDLAAALDAEGFAPEARAYLDVLREAVRRLEKGRLSGGDGALGEPAPIER